MSVFGYLESKIPALVVTVPTPKKVKASKLSNACQHTSKRGVDGTLRS